MSPVDDKIDRGADKLERMVEAGQRAGGKKAKVAKLFADDPEFLRKLKPSLIAARAKGRAPTAAEPTESARPVASSPPPAPQPPAKPSRSGGPNHFLVIGAAFAIGVALARVVDWLGHRYPRD